MFDKSIFKDFIFGCQNCGKEFPLHEFRDSVDLYGLIVLSGKNDGYFGTVCPKCFKTTLKKAGNQYIYSVKEYFNRLADALDHEKEILRYHSIPYNLDYHQKDIPVAVGPFVSELHYNLNRMEALRYSGSTDDYVGDPDGYCTYLLNDAVVGSALAVWWFRKEHIDRLVDIENETGLKVFPRYFNYDQLLGKIDTFCWINQLESESYQFRETIDPFNGSEWLGWGEFQRWVRKNFDFLQILSGILRDPLNPNIDSLFAESLKNKGKQQSEIEEPYKCQRMAEEVWRNYHKKYIQELLSMMSDGFISKYIHLTQKTDFSIFLVSALIYGYLKQLCDSIESPPMRVKAKSKSFDDQRKELAEIEKKFPSFKKIITQDYEVNKLKIESARRSQNRTKNKIFLLLGETGTGKELFANAIHEASGSQEGTGKKRPFTDLNIAAISPTLFESEFFGYEKGAYTDAKREKAGLFEQAKGGTIFLDEIGELDLKFQADLLRVIEKREIRRLDATQKKSIDCTIVLATNKELLEEVEKGNFRRDLYMRINRIELRIPPLRKRKGDILPLVKYFIEESAKELESSELASIGITDDGIDLLMKCEWPGNVRELMNVISKIMENRSDNNERGDITYSELREAIPDFHLSKKTTPKAGKGRKKLRGNTQITDDEIIYWMKEFQNNKTRVSEKLKVNVRTIRLRCKPLGL